MDEGGYLPYLGGVGAKLGQNNVRGEQTKEAIIVAAEEMFAESGYQTTPLASIAERAGVTQSGLLHHFRTKSDLLVAVLDRMTVADDERFLSTISIGTTSLMERLRNVVLEICSNRVQARLFIVLVAESTSADHPGHDYMTERFERLRNRLTGALSVAVERGQIVSTADLTALSTAIIGIIDGVQLQWIYRSEIDMVSAFDVLAQAVTPLLEP